MGNWIATPLVRHLAAGLLGLALGMAASAAVAAERQVRLVYDVYSSGLHSLTAEIDAALAPECFDIRLVARPAGLPALFSDFTLKSQAQGCRNAVGIAPEAYSSLYRTDKKRRWVEIDYSPSHEPMAQVDPLPQDDNRKAVPQDLRLDSLDPVSAAFAILQSFTDNGRCAEQLSVYDGRRLFAVQLKHVRAVRLRSVLRSTYEGKAVECRVSLDTVAGFKNSELRKNSYPEEITIFLANPAENVPVVPVRFETKDVVGLLRLDEVKSQTAAK